MMRSHCSQPPLIQISAAELGCLIGFFDLGQGRGNQLLFFAGAECRCAALIR
jgi:hypothetical protein